MRVKQITLKQFKRFDDLTLDFGESPKKIVALVGPNGCGKSSIFDAFEEKMKDVRNHGSEGELFYSKAKFTEDEAIRSSPYNKHQAISITTTTNAFDRKSFYIRTAYRFTSKINVGQISAMPDILNSNDEPISSIAIDTRLESNYKRLLASGFSEFFAGTRTGADVKQELIGNVNKILNKVIDAEISDLGDIMNGRGQFYFRKGGSTNFPYANLSSGEKEVVDIIIDLIIKTKEFNESVICIDEPELHLNTSIQRKLLIEIEKLIPENCQLWVATHSIGFLRALQEELKVKADIVDFSAKDYFTGTHVLTPMVPSRANWQRIFGTALEDLTGLVSPRVIVYCEGKDTPGENAEERGLDAIVYNNIFGESRNDTLFISSGGNTELDQRSDIAIRIISKVFSNVKILVLKDRDMASGRSTEGNTRVVYLDNNPSHHRVLKRFELENYLYDMQVLKTYCGQNGLIFDEAIYNSIVTDIDNQPVKDLTGRIKAACGITVSISASKFKENLSHCIHPDTDVYSELESCIFDERP